MITIPGGPFLMGSDRAHDPQTEVDELPQHRVEVAAFQIAKYPVTVAEYALAVAATAVRESPEGVFFKFAWAKQRERPDHPVVNVSWQHARAYITWLREASGERGWRLPSEAEWEKAARWDEDGHVSRIYPWGDKFDSNRFNTYESFIDTTSTIGSYPATDSERSGASPYGVEEMAGNVWEWTFSLYKPYPYTQSDGREDPKSTENRTLRGGSRKDYGGDTRVAYRSNIRKVRANYYLIGFRLALSPGAGSP